MIFNDFPIRDPYEFELEQVMQHIVDCHNLMCISGEKLPNDENEIRNQLVEGYLSNSAVMRKLQITDYLFNSEVGVFRESDFKQVGRSDIKVALRSSSFDEPKKHFIVECKRVDSETGLNREYVQEGVMRFTTQQYPTFLSLNGMIGFCVKTFDIHENSTIKINRHLNKWCPNETIQPLTQEKFIEDFEYSYTSNHYTTSSKKQFKLYHIMLDMTGLL